VKRVLASGFESPTGYEEKGYQHEVAFFIFQVINQEEKVELIDGLISNLDKVTFGDLEEIAKRMSTVTN